MTELWERKRRAFINKVHSEVLIATCTYLSLLIKDNFNGSNVLNNFKKANYFKTFNEFSFLGSMFLCYIFLFVSKSTTVFKGIRNGVADFVDFFKRKCL